MALVGTMSMNAQIMKPGMEIMKNGEVVATFTADQADKVVFKKVAISITGTAKRTGDIDVNWVQLWENGPKFAEYNVGVTDDKAESFGGYYYWGGSKDKDPDVVYERGAESLSGKYDTATKLWGSKWRMPTQAELQALLNNENCTCTWAMQNGVNGLLCRGKEGTDYASNSVFLPAAGYYNSDNVRVVQGDGYYWSSMPYGSDKAYNLYFKSSNWRVDNYYRDRGISVRAVLNETK